VTGQNEAPIVHGKVNVKPGRNDLCPCGSGKKYKNCCGQDGSGDRAPREDQPQPTVAGPPPLAAPADMSRLVALFNAGRYADMESKARELVGRQPDIGIYWKALGVSLRVQGRDALPALRRAADLLPDDAEAHNNLGNALLDLGRRDEAVASYRRALRIEPRYAEAHSNLGNALRDLGQIDEAVASYRRALEINPESAGAHANLGNAMRDLGRLEDAVASYHRALAIKPGFAEAHNNLGNALRGLRRFADAAASYRRALEIKADNAEAHNNLGNVLMDLKRLDEAADSYRRALALNPTFAQAHSNLGNALRGLGQLDDAVASYLKAVDIKPDFAGAHCNLGNALRDLGQLDKAVASHHRALEIEPDLAGAHNGLGNALLDFGKYDDAAASYRQALAIDPSFAEAHNNLGLVLRLLGRTAEAEASCRRSLAINPNVAATNAFLAELRSDRGEFAEAEALFKHALSIDPEFPEAWAGLAHLRKMTRDDAAWAAEAQRIADRPPPPRQEVYLRYAIGKYFDDVKEYEPAFFNFRRANELSKRYGAKHDRQLLTQGVDLITRSDRDQSWLRRARAGANQSARPVFIVGMPRSGTTLAEQILASHPAVFGAGELTFWHNASAATYKSSAPNGAIGEATIDALAEDYLRLLQDLAPDALRVVDKMPANFLSLGLIHAALPGARIVHMRRSPIDTCLSIYFQHFKTAHFYANDLDDLAHYYAQYLRVMAHWRATLPEAAMLDVPYEALIDDQEAWSRKMLEFIGLPWDPVCLDFHRAERAVITASKWQVRQRINRSSVERWRNYEKFVGPLLHLNELDAARPP
jgi:tetratricopeptide (TPR) repeat protein